MKKRPALKKNLKTFRCTDQMLYDLDDISEETGRNMSEIVREAVYWYILLEKNGKRM